MKTKYYLQINKEDKILFTKIFEVDTENSVAKSPLDIMEENIKMVCTEEHDLYNTNLYQLVWINGV